MMIEYKNGNIFFEDADAIVNTVNCVGVMGRGLALQYKNKFPQNFKEYALACKEGQVVPAKMFVFQTGQLTNTKYIINFPTKRYWKGKSKIEDIENGLDDLRGLIDKLQIKSIAIPQLGSRIGGLSWMNVQNIVASKLSDVESKIVVYEPLETKIEKNISKKASYGLYADNLRHVFNAIEGHLINAYEDAGDAPEKQITLLHGAVEDAKKFLKNQQITQEHFEKVTQLVDGFETPYGLELLAMVHWVYKYKNAYTLEETIEKYTVGTKENNSFQNDK